MQFYYKNKKHFGNTLGMLLDILDENNIELNEDEHLRLLDIFINDEVPDKYFRDGLLDVDLFAENPTIIYEIL